MSDEEIDVLASPASNSRVDVLEDLVRDLEQEVSRLRKIVERVNDSDCGVRLGGGEYVGL